MRAKGSNLKVQQGRIMTENYTKKKIVNKLAPFARFIIKLTFQKGSQLNLQSVKIITIKVTDAHII